MVKDRSVSGHALQPYNEKKPIKQGRFFSEYRRRQVYHLASEVFFVLNAPPIRNMALVCWRVNHAYRVRKRHGLFLAMVLSRPSARHRHKDQELGRLYKRRRHLPCISRR